ncbi:MAG: hypothetical protein H3C54_14370 [Taibaiella sp.]|nr:hypothetical protein [Taibaiella sp.]
MIRNLIIEMAPALILVLIALFAIVKVSIISVSLHKNYFSLFFNSLLFFNRVTIRNTFHEKLKAYYKKSNKVNAIFYVLIVIVLALYLLMKAI